MMATASAPVDIVGAASRMCADLTAKYGSAAMSDHTGLTTSYLDSVRAGQRLTLPTLITLVSSEILSIHGGEL